MSPVVQVIGLGKLGCPLAAVLASKGFEVIGVDRSSEVVKLVNDRLPPVAEPGLGDLLKHYPFTAVEPDLIGQTTAKTDATFIIVPTPSKKNGGFSNKYVLEAVTAVGRGLRNTIVGPRHLVVVCSTVMPGSMNGEIADALGEASLLRVGRDVGLCYSPEFIALGSVINDMLHPDMVLIGESDEESGEQLAEYMGLINLAPSERMSLIDAEITKLAVNAYVTMKISFANTLAEMAEGYEGANASVISDAMGLDTRIGRRYLKPATAYGGPCFPRDTAAFARAARDVGVSAPLADATHKVNIGQAPRIANLALGFLGHGGRRTVAVLGLAYKAGTAVIEQSVGVDVAAELAAAGVLVTVHDPEAMTAARSFLGTSVAYAKVIPQAPAVIIIATPWDAYKGIQPRLGQTVIDCWGVAVTGLGRLWRVGVGK